MKKLLTMLGIAAASSAYAQGGTLIVNNYSIYEYQGSFIANNFAGGCFPTISTDSLVIIPPDSYMGNGDYLQYDNYRDQFSTSLYPMAKWIVSTALNSSNIRPWNHASLLPGGPLSNNTKWSATKFTMVYQGTTVNVPGFTATISIANNPCNPSSDYFTTPDDVNSAEIFTITASGGIVETYIQLY